MQPETRLAAIQHAIECYPQESCGLIIVADGIEQYVPCVNKATTKSEHFIIAAEQYAEIEDMGTITAVVHSHPDAHQRPSEADQVSCELSGLPWYIFAIHKNDEGVVSLFGESSTEPRGYEAPLVGREFAFGVLDCYTLIKDYYHRELGIELPEAERADGWWNKGENLYIDNYQQAGFESVNGTDLQIGDVILMQIRSKVPNHAGVYIGDGLFLHHLYGRLSSRDIYGGYWRECTRIIVRRKSNG